RAHRGAHAGTMVVCRGVGVPRNRRGPPCVDPPGPRPRAGRAPERTDHVTDRPLFHLETDGSLEQLHAPLLYVSLEGFIDAGYVRDQILDHLFGTLEHEVVARFDVDELVDYRGRRPAMTFDRDRYTDYDQPSLL